MPEIDEVVLHDLMHRATADLHAPSGVTAGLVSLHRRRRIRARLLGVGATGAAAGIVAGALVSGTGSGSPAARSTAPHSTTVNGTIKLTAAQRTLYHLSDAAAATTRPAGRYVVMREKQTTQGNNGGEESSESIDVINTATGGGLTYQDYPGAPHQLSDAAGTTQAQYDAMPTAPAVLREFLLAQARQQNAQAAKVLGQKFKQAEKRTGQKFAYPAQPKIDPSTLVYEQATYTLWSPLLSPALRAALYKVLAATPGVVVKTGVKDSLGRPADEISRYNSFAHEYTEVFDNPATGATLETADVTPANPRLHITASYGSDLYQSITRTNTIPPNPYR